MKIWIYLLIISYFSISHKLTSKNKTFPSEIVKILARREMRIHHYLFHGLRNQWNSLDEIAKNSIRKMGWEPPRPSLTANNRVIFDNNSGEDFLFMHRQMIKEVNSLLSKGNYSYGKKIVSWKEIPAPKDPYYPVPPTYSISDGNEILNNIKSDAYYYNILKPLSDRYKNTSILRNLTLGQLGARLEFEVHNQMHIRWSKAMLAYREDILPFYQVQEIDKKWDDPSYDWLLDTYSSHVTEVFWRLHGWIDDRIDDWQKANRLDCIIWKGMWTGVRSHNHSHLHSFLELSSEQINKNERVFQILQKTKNKNSYLYS